MLKTAMVKLSHLPRDSRDTLFLLAVIAWVLVPQTPHLPLWCSLLAAGVLGWRATLAIGGKALPGRWWLLGLLAITIGATLLSHKTLLGRDAGVTLLVVLLTLKTLELRARRDAFVVFFLGFFCMLSNFFHSQSLLIAASMLVGLLGLLTVLVNAHMPAGKPPLVQAFKTASWMALLGAPIMVVLFVLFPRLAPLWGVSSDAVVGRSGLSEKMQVGTIAKLALDDSVAMRIRFDGKLPAQSDMYLRGPVLSSFDGREWRPARPDFSSRFSVTASLVVTGTPTNYEVTLEQTNRPWLFVLDATLAEPILPGYQPAMQADLQWLVNKPISALVRYKAQSHTRFQHGPDTSVIGLREFVELPPGFNPRTLAEAVKIRNDPQFANAGSAVLVDHVMGLLRTGGYTYTLEPGLYGPNTADDFWYERKEGFCEHIASSFVIMMRALDVPARVVTGYQGGELNGIDGFWTVRQSDAHAWAEVWMEGRGWVRVDPTSAVSPGRTGTSLRSVPAQGFVAQALGNISPAFSLGLRAMWDAVNTSWNQWVLNYTQGKQLDLLKNMGFQSPSWQDLSYVLIGIIVAVSLGGAAWSLWERTQHDPWLRLLARAHKKLAKAGVVTSQNVSSASTPRQLAVLLKARHGNNHDALHTWLMQLEAQRYARQPPAGQQLRQLQQQFNALVWPA